MDPGDIRDFIDGYLIEIENRKGNPAFCSKYSLTINILINKQYPWYMLFFNVWTFQVELIEKFILNYKHHRVIHNFLIVNEEGRDLVYLKHGRQPWH